MTVQISECHEACKREFSLKQTTRPDRIVSIECRSRVYFIVSLKGGGKKVNYPLTMIRSSKSLKHASLDDRSKFARYTTLCGTKGPYWANLIRLFCVFSKLSTCLQYIGDSQHQESKEVINVTPRDGLNSPTVRRLAERSALGAAYGLSWAHCL